VRTGVSPLIQLHRGERQFDPRVALAEATAERLAPPLPGPRLRQAGTGAAGATRPGRGHAGFAAHGARIRRHGQQRGRRVSRCAADGPGSLPAAEALRALGTGVYLSDLHYLNYSDRRPAA
jgi:hypothetical protein